MHNVYLFQPQYAVDVRKETNYWLPYSIACVWSYAQQFDFVRDNFTLIDTIFNRRNINELLDSMEDPKFCAFSCYIWNEQYCLEVAKQIKQKWPNCFIVFGGSQAYPATLSHPFVDSVVLSEGEEHFVSILRDLSEGKVPKKLYVKTRIDDLNIPSPYLTGIFDKIIANNPGVIWAMVLETNRGCPYQCTFCDWGGLTYSKVRKFDLEKIQAELEWAVQNKIGYLFIADANFGMFKDRDLEIAKLIRSAADRGRIESVNATFAKNSTESIFEIAKILGTISRGVTFSVQSMNEPTLDAIKRKNLDTNNIKHFMELSQKYNINTYTEAIVGLPEETLESWKTGLAEILEMGQHDSIEVWLCQLLENSELNSFESILKYGIKTVSAQDYMPYYNPNDCREIVETIKIINKTNTMSTEEITEAYVYGWMIIQFHIKGYTQIFAKYCRNVLNISYRVFYDVMFKELETNASFVDHFNKLKENTYHYLKFGEFVDDNVRGHALGSNSFEYIFNNKQLAYDLGQKCTSTFINDTKIIDSIQRLMIYDTTLILPKPIVSPWDLHTWEPVETEYIVSSKINTGVQYNFYTARRNNLLKNTFTKSSNSLTTS